MNTISPEFSFLYEYKFEEDANAIDVHISFPTNFDSTLIKAELSADHECLAVRLTAKGHVPIIKGRLFKPVKGIQTTRDKNELIIRLEKSTPVIWKFIIDDFYDNTEKIDPQSAYRKYKRLRAEDPSSCNAYLEIAVIAGYSPALRHMYKDILSRGNEELALTYLETAVNKYADTKAMLLYAKHLEKSPLTVEDSYLLFERVSTVTGSLAAKLECAKIKSPCSNIGYHKKNANLAVNILSEILLIDENNAEALHELAELIKCGQGIKKNNEQAAEIQSRAVSIDPNIPPLLENYQLDEDTTATSMKIIAVAAAVVAAASVGGFFAFRYIRNRKH